MKTIADQTDEIAAQVARELPPPIGGFESEDAKEGHRRAQERRFMELCATYPATA